MSEIIGNLLSNPWAILFVVLFFGASIFVHELGHYLAARWRGLVVERFSIGFGPRLFGWRNKRGVDFRISAIPLGGYVALPQLSDMRGIEGESGYTAEELPPLSYTDKMVVSVAGAVFNVIFAFLIATVVWWIGLPVEAASQTTTVGYVVESQLNFEEEAVPGAAHTAGIRPGDRIVAVDGDPVDDWESLALAVASGSGRTDDGHPLARVTIERDGVEQTLDVLPVLMPGERMRALGVYPVDIRTVDRVFAHSPAEEAGIRSGDKITALNGTPIYHVGALSAAIMDLGADKELELTVVRAGQEIPVKLTAKVPESADPEHARPMIGVQWAGPEYVVIHKGPLEQIQDAVSMTFRVLGALLNPKTDVGVRNLSGPVGISYAMYLTFQLGFPVLLWLVGVININLAVLNLMPIPVLDGGHMAFATIQKLTGRALPQRFISGAQGAFMLLLLMMVLYVSFFDIRRVGTNERARIDQDKITAPADPVFAEE